MTNQEEEKEIHSNIRDLHFLKLKSQDSIEYFKNCLAKRTNENQEKWLVILEDQYMQMEKIIGELTDLELDLDDEIYLAITSNNNQQYHIMNIWELYKIGNKLSPLLFNKVGQLNENNILEWTRVPLWKRRQNLQGHKLKLTTMPEAPFITSISEPDNDGKVEVNGMFKDLLDLISDTLNITYILKPPADKKWGQDDGNGNWNGMIGLLQKEEADIGK